MCKTTTFGSFRCSASHAVLTSISERRFFEPNPSALASWEGVDLDTASSSMSIVASRGIASLHSLGHLDVSKTVFSLIGILAAPISLQEVCLYNEINTARESLSATFLGFWLAFTDKTRTFFRGIAF